MIHLFIGAGIAVALLLSGKRLVVWWRFSNQRLRQRTVRLESFEAQAGSFRPVFDEAARTLAESGFSYSHTLVCRDFAVGVPEYPCWIFTHESEPICAEVETAHARNGPAAFDVRFIIRFDDDSAVLTGGDEKNPVPLPFPENIDVVDPCADAISAQLEAHRRAVAGRSRKAAPLSWTPEEHEEWENRLGAARMNAMWRRGLLQTERPGVFRLTPAAAWQYCSAYFKDLKRREAAARTLICQKREEPDPAPVVSADVHAFERERATEKHRHSSPARRLCLLLVSTAVGIVAFGLLLSWEIGFMLVAVVLVHEFGHLLGMKLMGERDTKILVIPFVGAATVGDEESPSPGRKIVKLLLGPLPGLILGMTAVLMFGMPDSGDANMWMQIGLMAVIINYLNLLPLLPLDGGQIVETLFLKRMPRIQFALLCLSIALFAALSVVHQSPIPAIPAVFLLFRLPHAWRRGSIARHARQHLEPDASREDCLRVLFRTMEEQAQQCRLGWGERYDLARSLLEQLHAPRPGPATVAAGTAAYISSLLLPFVVLFSVKLFSAEG